MRLQTTRVGLSYLPLLTLLASCVVAGAVDFFYFPKQRSCILAGCQDFTDDAFLHIQTEPFPFYGRLSPTTVTATTNGVVTFGDFVLRYRDVALNTTQRGTVALFYHDADLSASGMLYHRDTTNSTTFDRANELIRQGFMDAGDFQARKIFVTTYLNVGYHPARSDLLNSYQSLIVTDFQQTYLILLYRDIQWLSAENDPRKAQVGVYAGDARHFYELPYSSTPELAMLTQYTNMDIPGLSLYRISGRTVEPGGCSQAGNSTLKMYPQQGSELGGNVVKVQGPCFSSTDTIQAEFGSHTVSCAYLSVFVAMCVVPPLPNPRTLSVSLRVNGDVKGQALYTTISSDVSYGIDVEGTSASSPAPLFLNTEELVILNYDPSNILPGETPSSFQVDVLLYGMNLETGEWVELMELQRGSDNLGSLSVTLPTQFLTSDIRPIAFFIGTSLASTTSVQSATVQTLRQSSLRAGIFSSVYYFTNQQSLESTRQTSCDNWFRNSSSIVATSLNPCPSVSDQAALPTSGFEQVNMTSILGRSGYSSQWRATFHSGAQTCYRQSLVMDRSSSSSAPSQQVCCYNDQGQLLSGSSSGSAVSAVAAEYDGRRHFVEDVRPYLLCCVGGGSSNCDYYYQRRPSGTTEGYQPGRPAWVIGDPHFITFDGMRYTFNGHGEFTLLRTHSDQFVIQGRMEPFPDNSSGSILTSVAVRLNQDRLNIVTNKVGENTGGMDVYLNDTRITMEYLPKMYFENFMISFSTSSRLSIQFLNGVKLECHTANGNITQLLVSLPNSMKGMVSGLMGTFDDDPSNDLSPLTPSGSLGVAIGDDSLEAVHMNFGLSWIVDSESNSLFEYFTDESFVTERNTSFRPVFDVSGHIISLCEGDFFCVYDVVVTKDITFATNTLNSVKEVAQVQRLSGGMMLCSPECTSGQGECQPNNVCACLPGFTGSQCQTRISTGCNTMGACTPPHVCMQDGTSYTCQCPEGTTGQDCSASTEAATSGPVINTVSMVIIIVGGVVIILGVAIPIIIIVIVVMVCKKKRKSAGNSKENVGEVDVGGDYSTTFDVKIATSQRKGSTTTSLPPSYSDLNLDNRNSIQMTKYNMRYSNGVDTIPENEPQYDIIGDKYQNVAIDASSLMPHQQQKPQCNLGVGSSQTPPLHPSSQEKIMVMSDRAQSHNVIPTSPASDEKKPVFSSSSSGNVSTRPVSRSSDNGQSSNPWYNSSNPSIPTNSPSRVPMHTTGISTLPENGVIPPVAYSKASTLPLANQPTSEHAYSILTPPTSYSPSSAQSRDYTSLHRPLDKSPSNNVGSGNTRVSSRQSTSSSSSSRVGSRQSNNLNRSIPECMNDRSLPTSDV